MKELFGAEMESVARIFGFTDAVLAAVFEERSQHSQKAEPQRRLFPALALPDERQRIVALPDAVDRECSDVAEIVVVGLQATLVVAHDQVGLRHTRRHTRAEAARLQVRAD